MESISNISDKLKESLLMEFSIHQLILIGATKVRVDENNDLDYVAIIEDSQNKFDFVMRSSPILVDFISKYKIQISCFPISRSEFLNKKSVFLENVRKDGVVI